MCDGRINIRSTGDCPSFSIFTIFTRPWGHLIDISNLSSIFEAYDFALAGPIFYYLTWKGAEPASQILYKKRLHITWIRQFI